VNIRDRVNPAGTQVPAEPLAQFGRRVHHFEQLTRDNGALIVEDVFQVDFESLKKELDRAG